MSTSHLLRTPFVPHSVLLRSQSDSMEPKMERRKYGHEMTDAFGSRQ